MTEQVTVDDRNYYTCFVGASKEYEVDVYQIMNKRTGVVEMETSVLLNAINTLDQLEEFAIEFYDEQPQLKLM